MIYSDKELSQTLIALCEAKGIDQVVISPGSRNAPLTLGFASNPYFTCFSVVDERSAAFFALGISQQQKKPVLLVCSSGSALLNYYPAIAEAFYSDIPLIVCSADRPKELIDVGDGQTIRQENVFQNHILYSANCQIGEGVQLQNEKEINIALNSALELNGPVHINLPFAEPLYQTVDKPSVRPQNVPARKPKWEAEDLASFRTVWQKSKRKMILVGTLPPNSLEEKFVNLLATDPSVLVLTESTSNLHHVNFFPAIDQLITPLNAEDFENLKPEILLTFGGMVISKRIKSFLRKYTPQHHWHVDPKTAYNTYFALTHHFHTTINLFLSQFLCDLSPVESDYQHYWLKVKNHRLQRQLLYEQQVPYSDFKVFKNIFRDLPKHVLLQLSNSATIRYAQLFPISPTAQVFCNRGTSGIDGSTSTAVGAAYASRKPTYLITGDLSFFYDSNGLWNNYLPKDFKIIVVNNSGGGIFRILPGEKDTNIFDTFFETKHNHNAKKIAEMFGFKYESIHNEEDLETKLSGFFHTSEGPALLEIFTPSTVNDKILINYFKFIA